MAIPKQGPVIAIDGPAGSGKSTTTKELANALGFVHVDTGALYRSIAYLGLEDGLGLGNLKGEIPAQEIPRVIELARTSHLEFKRDAHKNPPNRVFANGKDVTDFIRTPQVSMAASKVSAIPEVRSALLGLQRRLGCVGKTILEGRDIGTVIFPDADLKIFLVATVEERARRRVKELQEKNLQQGKNDPVPTVKEMQEQIRLRDHGDSSRATAPLKKAEDAIEVDTSNLSINEVVQKIANLARQHIR